MTLLKAALVKSHPGSPEPSVELGPTDDDIPRFATLRAPTTAVTPAEPASDVFKLWEQYVSKVELSIPLKPSGPPPFSGKRRITKRYQEDASAPLLIGMMDDGCPFAAAQFLRGVPNGPVSTRVRAIWDQNRASNSPGRALIVSDKCYWTSASASNTAALLPCDQPDRARPLDILHSTPTGRSTRVAVMPMPALQVSRVGNRTARM